MVVYKSYVRPVIEYADVVWHSGLTYKQAGDLERIQRRACRTILGHQFSTYTEAIKQCNLDRLSERRVDHCLNPCSPEGFSQTYFPKGGCCNPPWIINTEGHITLTLLPVYRYGHLLSIDTKISTNH